MFSPVRLFSLLEYAVKTVCVCMPVCVASSYFTVYSESARTISSFLLVHSVVHNVAIKKKEKENCLESFLRAILIRGIVMFAIEFGVPSSYSHVSAVCICIYYVEQQKHFHHQQQQQQQHSTSFSFHVYSVPFSIILILILSVLVNHSLSHSFFLLFRVLLPFIA